MFDHPGEIIIADLIPETAGSAVNQDGNLILLQAEGRRGNRIKDLFHHLDFQKMIARSQGAQLLLARVPWPGR